MKAHEKRLRDYLNTDAAEVIVAINVGLRRNVSIRRADLSRLLDESAEKDARAKRYEEALLRITLSRLVNGGQELCQGIATEALRLRRNPRAKR